jgi:hypothetical protein
VDLHPIALAGSHRTENGTDARSSSAPHDPVAALSTRRDPCDRSAACIVNRCSRCSNAIARSTPTESATVDAFERFVRTHADCFERTCAPGHITGSAWILSSDRRRVLLTHHRKLGRWLQLGGHADGDPDPLRVAMREAREDSDWCTSSRSGLGGESVPLDLDIHRIPARGDEPAHLHHDVRYLLVAAPGQADRDQRGIDPTCAGSTRDELPDRIDEESPQHCGIAPHSRADAAPPRP